MRGRIFIGKKEYLVKFLVGVGLGFKGSYSMSVKKFFSSYNIN